MNKFNKQTILQILSSIQFSEKVLVSSKTSDIVIKGNKIGFALDITDITRAQADILREHIIKKLKSDIDALDKITIILTTARKTLDDANITESKKHSTVNTKTADPRMHIENVKNIILVSSGKGGVGKSTISALLAHKLCSEGHKVGIVDADIYGPSMPHLFDLKGKPQIQEDKMIPLCNYGIVVNSIGFLTDPLSSISWRGPMVSKALYQLLSLTKWPKLEYLIIDTPPGTGDIHLSLLQNYHLDQVIMITTPHQISEIDVRRSINLYQKFNVPIMGVIENMGYPENDAQYHNGSGNKIAKDYNIPLLAQIPITSSLAYKCDDGGSLLDYIGLIQNVKI